MARLSPQRSVVLAHEHQWPRTLVVEAIGVLYGLLADLTVVIHLGFVGFVALGGFFAIRHPVVLYAHVPAVLWSIGIVTIGWSCPLTSLEVWLRAQAGTYASTGGFVDHYLTGVLYPEQFERLAQGLVGIALAIAYVNVAVHRHGRVVFGRPRRRYGD